MKATVIPMSTQIGNLGYVGAPSLHPSPTAPGVNTEGTSPLAVPVPPGPSGLTTDIDHGPSTQPSMYQYPYPPKG